jgi:hypothetical protein
LGIHGIERNAEITAVIGTTGDPDEAIPAVANGVARVRMPA